MKYLLGILVMIVFIAIAYWVWSPAIGCDGNVVQGAFRMVCIQ